MHTNIMFPVMAVIHDVEFTDKIPRYQIRITKFYDDINFLKRYLFNMNYEKDFQGRRTKFKLKRTEYSKMEDFQNLLDSSGDKYKVVVCNHTGTIAIYDKKKDQYYSPLVDGGIEFDIEGKDIVNSNKVSKYGREFSIVEIPYCFKLLIQELSAMNIQMRLITTDNVNTFK